MPHGKGQMEEEEGKSTAELTVNKNMVGTLDSFASK